MYDDYRHPSDPPLFTPQVRPIMDGQLLFPRTPPLYWRSHWLRRSLPCLASESRGCPWCSALPARSHAYVLVAQQVTGGWRRWIADFPAAAFHAAMHAAGADSLQSQAIRVARKPGGSFHLTLVPSDVPALDDSLWTAVLAAVARLYRLPDPRQFEDEARWTAAAIARCHDPRFSE